MLRQLRPYLLNRAGLIDFYHRNLLKAIREHKRLLASEKQQQHAHARLAEYFNAQHYWLESLEEQQKRAKTLPPTPRPANVRKVDELPWQLLQAANWPRSEQLLTDLAFLEAKAEAGMVFDLATDFSAVCGGMPAGRPLLRILRLLEEALRRDIHFIARHAKDYPQALFQSLWNHGWWYDHPDAVKHYDGHYNPPSHQGMKFYQFLETWRRDKEKQMRGFVWIRSLRPPPIQIGSPLLAVIRVPESGALSVAYSPNGEQICGASHNTVRVWDAKAGEELLRLIDHNWVTCVVFSPDGGRIASVSKERCIQICDAGTGEALQCLSGHEGTVLSVVFSPDGSQIASGSTDKTVRIWDAHNGRELCCLRAEETEVGGCVPNSVVYSPDGMRVVSSSRDMTVARVSCNPSAGTHHAPFLRGSSIIRVWDARTGELTKSFCGHEAGVTSVAYSPDGQRIASGSNDYTVQIWDAETGELLGRLRGHKDVVSSVVFSSDGTQIASGSNDHTVRIWNTQTSKMLACFSGHVDAVSCVAFSPDSQRIISSSSDATIRVWDA